MATSEWLRFFSDAGIPPGPALGYAVAFVDNRIHKDMLLDLTRELMKELGITAVGDAIAILRHARAVHRQEMCRVASESLQPRPEPEPEPEPTPERRRRGASAAGRMIRQSLSRHWLPRAPPTTGICVTVTNGGPPVPAPPAKRRRVRAEPEPEQEGQFLGQFLGQFPGGVLPKGGSSSTRGRRALELQEPKGLGRTSVFERLGAEAKAEGKPSGVFGRLGAPPDPPEPHPGADPGADPGVDPQEEEEDEEPLPYAGVLKKPRECSRAPPRPLPPDPGGLPPPLPLPQDGAVSSSGCLECLEFRGKGGGGSVFRRLGRKRE